jgi:hypothetical protein
MSEFVAVLAEMEETVGVIAVEDVPVGTLVGTGAVGLMYSCPSAEASR